MIQISAAVGLCGISLAAAASLIYQFVADVFKEDE